MKNTKTNKEYQDAAELLYTNSTSGVLVTVFAAVFLVYQFYVPATQTFKLYWLTAILAVAGVRLYHAYRFKQKKTTSNYNGKTAVYQYIAGTISTGVLLAIYASYTFQQASDLEASVIILTLAGLAGGAASVLAAHKPTAISYALILLTPASITLSLSESEYQNMFGILGFAYSLVIAGVANNAAKFTAHSIHLKNENTELLEDMEKKVDERTKQIYKLSNLDPLTNIYNRSAFLHHLSLSIRRCAKHEQPLSLLFIDLDGFKKVNDSLGHATGDAMLIETSSRLRSIIGEHHLLCRWGGDEFVIALNNTEKENAITFAQSVIALLSKQHIVDENKLSIGATIGIAIYPEHSTLESELIQLADTAMYVQKKKHAGHACLFNKQMGERLKREQFIKLGLASAIERNEMHLVFQAIVDTQSLQPTSFEALLRWQADGNAISPVEFIPVAEQYGLIEQIGNWVLLQSCEQAAAWSSNKEMSSISVSVNVSVLQLSNENFYEYVESCLVKAGLAPSKLIIEITESIFAEDEDALILTMRKLQTLGVKVAVDDFGTEYSSLSVIQNLAANYIKIDRSFVSNIDSKGFAIIQAIKHLATSLDYAVVVEGIETEQQLQIVRDLGVDMIQGFFISKPLPAESIEAFLREHRDSKVC